MYFQKPPCWVWQHTLLETPFVCHWETRSQWEMLLGAQVPFTLYSSSTINMESPLLTWAHINRLLLLPYFAIVTFQRKIHYSGSCKLNHQDQLSTAIGGSTTSTTTDLRPCVTQCSSCKVLHCLLLLVIIHKDTNNLYQDKCLVHARVWPSIIPYKNLNFFFTTFTRAVSNCGKKQQKP